MNSRLTAGLAGIALFSLITAPLASATPLAPRSPVAASSAVTAPVTTPSIAAPASAYGYTYAGEWAYTTDVTDRVRSIAVSPRDEVFVLGHQGKIRRYTLTGTLTEAWETPVRTDPEELAVDPRNGDLHVGIWGDVPSDVPSGVLVYSRDGALLRSYAIPGDDMWATGIAIAADGTSYVANTHDDQIHRFSSTGQHQGSFGGEGVAPGQFDGPSSIAIGTDGTLYVTDDGNDRVQQFKRDGTAIRTWGQAGIANGRFMQPNTIAVAPSGNVLVTEQFTRRVQEFTPTGSWVRTFGEDRLSDTFAIGFDRHGALYAGGTLRSVTEGVAKFVPAKPTGQKTAITVKAKKKTHGKRSKVQITVSKKATGKVTVKAGKKTVTGKLKAGKVIVRLPKKAPKPGNRTITVTYSGVPGKFRPSATTAKLRVVKAKPTIKVKSFKKRVKAGKKATFRITVKAAGVKPRGKVTVKANGAKAKTVKLNKKGRAKVTLRFAKKAKAGKRTLKVTYRGTKLVKKTVAKKGTITVRR